MLLAWLDAYLCDSTHDIQGPSISAKLDYYTSNVLYSKSQTIPSAHKELLYQSRSRKLPIILAVRQIRQPWDWRFLLKQSGVRLRIHKCHVPDRLNIQELLQNCPSRQPTTGLLLTFLSITYNAGFTFKQFGAECNNFARSSTQLKIRDPTGQQRNALPSRTIPMCNSVGYDFRDTSLVHVSVTLPRDFREI